MIDALYENSNENLEYYYYIEQDDEGLFNFAETTGTRDMDEYGDLSTLTSQMNSPDFVFGKNGAFRFNETVIPKEFIPNLNRVIDLVSDTKAKIYFGFPPHNKNNVEKSSLNDSAFDSYNKWLAKTVHCPLISDIRDYIYNAEYFDNTDYHLNTIGREMHTKQLAQDLKAANIGIK